MTGKTIKNNLREIKPYPINQKIIRATSNPIKKDGHLIVLRGNIAPNGAIAKISGKEGTYFKGTARVFDSEENVSRRSLLVKFQKDQ